MVGRTLWSLPIYRTHPHHSNTAIRTRYTAAAILPFLTSALYALLHCMHSVAAMSEGKTKQILTSYIQLELVLQSALMLSSC